MTRARPVFIGLGSNLGDRAAMLAAALEALDRTPGVALVRISDAYETAPLGPPQPRYLNAAAELATELAPRELLDRMQAIERSLGRDRSRGERWGARTIDLDLLLDGESVCGEPGLTLPHPRMAERVFVLVPLAEIAPSLRHPQFRMTILSLLARLRESGGANEPIPKSDGEPVRIGPILSAVSLRIPTPSSSSPP